MKELSFKEVQERGKFILRFIKKICDENNIKYYLAYGTVLGAVRHKGFIPWDDDIDICMTRQEYHKFKLAMQNQKSSYYLFDIESDPQYFLPLAKVVDNSTTMNWQVVRKKSSFGVWVDVFILDNIPDDETLYLRFYNKMKLLKRLYEHSLYKCNFNSFKASISNVLLSWTILLGPRFFVMMITKYAQKYNKHKTQRVASASFFVYRPGGEAIDIKMLENPDIVDFEGEKYPVPSPYDTYLRNIYGDYMTLPPLEHRKPNHTAVFYQLD